MKKFWTRAFIWFTIAIIAPIVISIVEYNIMFPATTSNTQHATMWMVVCAIIGIIGLFVVANYIKKGLPFSMGTQFLNVVLKVIFPLLIIFGLTKYLSSKIDEIVEILNYLSTITFWIILCELSVSTINPFPKWANDNIEKREDSKTKKFIEKMWKNRK